MRPRSGAFDSHTVPQRTSRRSHCVLLAPTGIFGNLPDPTSTNQPAVQSVASIKGGYAIAGTPGFCLSYLSPYQTCISSSNPPMPLPNTNNSYTNAQYSCSAVNGWQVTVQGIVTAIFGDYFVIQNSTGSEATESRLWSGVLVYVDGVTAYNGPTIIGQQVKVSGNPYSVAGGTQILDGYTDGVQNYNGGAQSPWGYGDAADTPTGQYPLQITMLNGGAVTTQPIGYTNVSNPPKTGWFSGQCGAGSPSGIAESLRNVRVTFTNVQIMTLESTSGFVILNDGTGNMTMNSQIVGLNQVSGVCGFKVGDTLASITLLMNTYSGAADDYKAATFGKYEGLLTQPSDVTPGSIASPAACFPRAFQSSPAVASIASLSANMPNNPVPMVSGTCSSFASPYQGTNIAITGVITGIYTPVFGFPDYSTTVGLHVITLQDSTNPWSGATYNLASDANACPVGTGVPGFCGSALTTGVSVTVTQTSPAVGKPGMQLTTDVGSIYVTSNGASTLPAAVAVTTGTFVNSSSCTTAAEPYRYMRVVLSNVVVKSIVPYKGSFYITIDDGTGPMFVNPSADANQHIAGQVAVYHYLNATTPGGLLVGDTIASITGVIIPFYASSSKYALMVPSPQPVLGCDADYRSCGPAKASDFGAVSRGGAVLTATPSNCLAKYGCYALGSSGTVSAPPPPPVTLSPTAGSTIMPLSTQPAGTCTSTDSCFVYCNGKITTGTVDGISGGNYAANMYFTGSGTKPAGCTCPTNCNGPFTHSKPSDPLAVALANAETPTSTNTGLSFICGGNTTAVVSATPVNTPGAGSITIAWSGVTTAASSVASTTCTYAVTSGVAFDISVFTSVAVNGNVAAIFSGLTLNGLTSITTMTPAAATAFAAAIATATGVDPAAVQVLSSYALCGSTGCSASGRRLLQTQTGLYVYYAVSPALLSVSTVSASLGSLGSSFAATLTTALGTAGVSGTVSTVSVIVAPSACSNAACATQFQSGLAITAPAYVAPSTSSSSNKKAVALGVGIGVGVGGALILGLVAAYFLVLKKAAFEAGQKTAVAMAPMPAAK